tara:strand:+ start:1137 stop:1553 length:417 start_codon:yes stop_codon:yes gene_type:complete
LLSKSCGLNELLIGGFLITAEVKTTPTKKRKQTMTKEEAIKRLKEVIKKGDTLFTQLCHVSQSGMMRHIKVRQIKDNRPLDWSMLVSTALDWKEAKNRFGGYNGIKVGGCGMDMGFHLVYTLSSVLYNDGYAIKHEWL